MQPIHEASQHDACFPDELGGAAPQAPAVSTSQNSQRQCQDTFRTEVHS